MRYIARLWLKRSLSAVSRISMRLPKFSSSQERSPASSFSSYAFLRSMSARSFMSRRVISMPNVCRVGITCPNAVSIPMESWPKMTTRRPFSACRVTAA